MSSNTSGEGDIRKNIVKAGLIDCMIALPSQLFFNTMIPACLWFIRRGKNDNKTLFIDARKLGTMITRRNLELTDEDIKKIADTYHNWRDNKKYEDVKGFCKSATLKDIEKNDYILTPGRYVGTEEVEEDPEVFEEKMKRLTSELSEQFKKSKN
jgi:type I restriction enzyme M protein